MKEYGLSETKRILDCVNDRIFMLDKDARILLLNEAFEKRYGRGTSEMFGRNIRAIGGDSKLYEEIILKCIESKKKQSRIFKREGENQEVLVTGVPKEILATALKVSSQDITILIQGESGTGKEIIAKFIYQNSSRRHRPFIKVNCGAIPENLMESELFGYEKGAFTGADEIGKAGLFELANGGTLFLDEIGYLPAQMQVKLLRAIQEREIMRIGGVSYIPIDIRIISATNVNLKEATEKGEFRSDLYYRLNVVPIMLEPLRKRKEDIYPLANRFLREFNLKYGKKKTIDESGWKVMKKYQWPGNVRELENLIECLVVTSESEVINGVWIAEHFSDFELEENFKDIRGRGLKSKVEEYEKCLILSQMQYYNRTQELADALMIDKSTLTRKMARYNIKY